mmetsp:Transcript_70394/g.184524  ORF Transcript_70394/g.184524 Transcript_70394/m.184524 type:complete len:536 (+) Transcript_70394:1835-3442(+)
MHQRVEALLPEGAAVLAQVRREAAAHGRQDGVQGGDVDLRDAHGLQSLDGRGARDLVLDALHEGREAGGEHALKGRQVAGAGHQVSEALQRALFHLLVDVLHLQLPAEHLEHRQHLHELVAGLGRARPQGVDVSSDRTEGLGDRLVVAVVAALQEERAERGRQLLVDRRRREVLAQVPHADEGVEAHGRVGLLHGPDQLVLDQGEVRLQVLRHALGQDPHEGHGALARLLRLGAQLLVQLGHAARHHGDEVLSRRPLLRRGRALHLQDACAWHRRGGGGAQPRRSLALDDCRLSHVGECCEDIQLHALLTLLEACDHRGGELGVDLGELVGQALDHGCQHLEGRPADLPGVVVVIGVHQPVVVEFVEAVLHCVVLVTCGIEVRVVRNQIQNDVAELIQVGRDLLGAAEHKGLERVEAVLDDLVVLLVVAVHRDVVLGRLVHYLQEERRDVLQVGTDAEANIAANSADALDVLLLLRLGRRRAHVRQERPHELVQLAVSQHRRESTDAGNHLLPERRLVLLRLQEVQQRSCHVLLV